MIDLVLALGQQLDRAQYRLRVNHGRLRHSAQRYYVPDLAVIPAELEEALLQTPGSLDASSEPLPLVGEIWSPSTGDYDIDAKIPDYMARGDLVIWRLYPCERSLIVRRRRSDGTYAQTIHHGGIVPVTSIPGVTIDLDALFDR